MTDFSTMSTICFTGPRPNKLYGYKNKEKYQKLVLNRLRKRNPMNYDILVKTKFQELSAAEVASEYGITPNNVNNRNLRSKAWIIEEMEKICRQSHR